MKSLYAVMAYPEGHFALTFPLRPSKGWPQNTGRVHQDVAQQRLVSAIYELERLVRWLGLARDRVQRGKRGPKRRAAPAYILVHSLNLILERFTGETITRSTKSPDTLEYVKAVCRIADPDIGDGTIIEAVKKEIKYYQPPFGEISLHPTGAIPPRSQRDKRPSVRKTVKRTNRDD